MATIRGTSGDDVLTGTDDKDTIDGKEGNDTIDGGAGNDTIDDGEGNDVVNGGDGRDTLVLSLGNDIIRGGAGDDLFIANTFNGNFSGDVGANELYGEGGNDRFEINLVGGSQLIDGGAGEDQLYLGYFGFRRTVSDDHLFNVIAGEDNDHVIVDQGGRVEFGPDGRVDQDAGFFLNTIDLGDGDDFVRANRSSSVLTLGAGADLVALNDAATFQVITDFAPGVDRIFELPLSAITNWNGSDNLFATGHLRLLQEGTDTFLQIDFDGGGQNWRDLIQFENLDASLLGAADIAGFSPSGEALEGVSLFGTPGDDDIVRRGGDAGIFVGLVGTNGPDFIDGGAGDDVIRAGYGNDTVFGGDGSDVIFVDWGNDIVSGGDGDDVIYNNGGESRIDGNAGSDKIYQYFNSPGHSIVHGNDGNDFLVIDISQINGRLRASAELHGDAGDDTFTLSTFVFDLSTFEPPMVEIFAGEGNDKINVTSVASITSITLGDGSDFFALNDFFGLSAGSIRVTDFDVSEDFIEIGDPFFGLMPFFSNTSGVTDFFASGHYRIVQEGTDTILQYDLDGGGTEFADLITFENVQASSFTANNFVLRSGTVFVSDMAPNTDFRNWIFGTTESESLTGDASANTFFADTGDDTLDGGSNVDTAVVAGDRSTYTITQTSTGVFEVSGPDGTDTLTAIEYLQFDDQTLRLLPGNGVSVNFETADPSVYQSAMQGIRDFDGNALGGDGSWLRIGAADVNGDGDIDQILVNDAIGRFATVGTAPDGLVYFDDHSWAGETRVAGIYIDPLVQAGLIEPFSDNDSQRRFQNDLQIENINRVLGADDYDGDGFQEVYFALTDGTAYLRAIMEFDGNISYANYQSEQDVIDYLTANGFGEETYGDWFTPPADQTAQAGPMTAFAPVAGGEVLDATPGQISGRPMSLHSGLEDPVTVEFFG